MKKLIGLLLVVAFLAIQVTSAQASYIVDAELNSSSGGIGLPTILLTSGQSFTVAVNPADLWSSGPIPRWSNADGLTKNLYATGFDESGVTPAGTLIGQNWGLYTQGSFSAPYGSLVGRIDSGDYFFIGTDYLGTASASGTLNLFYWDSNSADNDNFITASVNVVPIPATALLFCSSILGIVGIRRKMVK